MLDDFIIFYINRTFINDKALKKKSCNINVIVNSHLHVPVEKLRNAFTDVLN